MKKEPKTKGVATTPIIIQLEALECGAASLAMVMAYYDKWVPLEQLRLDCGISRDGSNAKNILKAARSYGFTTRGVVLSTKKLREKGRFPCIIHWNSAHFVVLCGFRGKKAIIHDPAKGKVVVPLDVFDKSFTGVCLDLVPGDDFTPGGKRKSVIQFAKKRLTGAGFLVLFFVLTTLILYVIGIANPIIRQVFLDNLLGGENPEWLLPFILIVSLISIIQIVTKLVEAIYKYKIRGKLALAGSSNYMWKVMRLPIEFFSQRMSGDIQQRKKENANIAETLVNVFAPLVLNVLLLVVYLTVMISKSLVLTAVGVVAVLLNTIAGFLISRYKVNATRVQARDNAMLVGMVSKGIEMIETIKSSGAEKKYYNSWSEVQETASNNKLKLARMSQLFGLVPSFLSLFVNYGVLLLGVYYTINGDFTVGSIFAFQGFLSAFMAPASLLINSGQALQEMRTQMERVDDVMEYRIDENVDREIKDGEYRQLEGNIELKDVVFGYSKLSDPLISGFTLSIQKGDIVSIVGGTGSGKSTLSKLLSGLYSQWSGEILFDGKRLNEIDHEVFVSSLAVVDQDIILFEDSILNNIKMWDPTISDEDAIRAAKDAQIHDVIMDRNGNYDALLLENGKNLSGGERQRMEIARALATNPSVIILDEATSALDADTEYKVVKAIKARGVTTIIIAHRLSTIKDSDLIVVLDKGKIIEQGTHDQLMRDHGYYFDLIQNG